VYVPTPRQTPDSPRVRELSRRIEQLITDFQREYPMTPAEIRQALLHAAGAVGGHRPRLAVALAAGVAAAVGLGVFVARRAGGTGEGGAMPLLVLIGVMAAMAGVVLAIRRSR